MDSSEPGADGAPTPADGPEPTPPGEIIVDDYEPAAERCRESLFGLGNGLVFARAVAAERDLASTRHYAGLYRAGLYDGSPRRVNGQRVIMASLVNLPDPFGLSFRAGNGGWFTPESVQLLSYRQRLLMDQGLLRRELLVRDSAGRRTHIVEERFVSMAQPRLLGQRWRFEPQNWSGRVEFRSTLDGAVINGNIAQAQAYEGRRLRALRHARLSQEAVELSANVGSPPQRMVLSLRTQLHGPRSSRRVDWDGACVADFRGCEVEAGTSLTIDKLAVLHTGEDQAPASATGPHQPAAAGHRGGLCVTDARLRYDDALDAHCGAWRALWQRMPLAAAAPELERALRFHCFHLLQTASPHTVGADVGLPARGWQEMYHGHVFWDDLLAFPFFATRFPEIARALVIYRHRRLDPAREAARRAGLLGAMFPWRSGRSGEEETPPFQLNPLSGRWMSDQTYQQRHVGSAIAYGLWQYWLVTGDVELMAGEGGELLLEIARFWASLAQWDGGRERYMIRGVMGPDEYHTAYPLAAQPGLDNNAYTNVMASWTLARAIELCALLPEPQSAALRRRLNLTDTELGTWDRISRRLFVPLHDNGAVISQFEGFDQLRPFPADRVAEARGQGTRLDWLLDAHGDSVNAYQVCKQPDVLMLMHLFAPADLARLLARLGHRYTEALAEQSRAYYLARLTHESSLSHVVCAGALAGSHPAQSWRYFREALDVDLGGGDRAGDGLHIGAMAGTLDVLQRHYLGLSFDGDGLHLRPAPPPGLADVSLGLSYQGGRYTLALEGERVRLSAASGNSAAVPVFGPDSLRRELQPGGSIEVAVRRGAGTPA